MRSAPRPVLFGALALQAGPIDAQQFVEARQVAGARPDTSLADLAGRDGGGAWNSGLFGHRLPLR